MGILGSIARFSEKILSPGTSHVKCGAHVTRYFMYRKLSTVLNDLSRGQGKKVLAISNSAKLAVALIKSHSYNKRAKLARINLDFARR
jgi:hypothetical protein